MVACRVLDAVKISTHDQGIIRKGNGAEMAQKNKARGGINRRIDLGEREASARILDSRHRQGSVKGVMRTEATVPTASKGAGMKQNGRSVGVGRGGQRKSG